MTKTFRLVGVVIAFLVLSGCAVANAIVDPYTDLHLRVSSAINPDDEGRASPLVVRIYELNSVETFRGANFFDLYDNAENVLGDELLNSTEIVLRPGRDTMHKLQLNKMTTHIGVIGAFRDIENSDWKLSFKAKPRNYIDRSIRVDRRSIYLERD